MSTMGLIFANIYDSSLGELTNKRTMASLPYAGRYRQIDFPISNMTNAGIRHIGIITKYNYQSLMNHISSGQEWDLDLGEGGLEFLTPYAMGHNGSYRGKLEAIDSASDVLRNSKEDYVVLSDSAVICAMDFNEIVRRHVESGADVSVIVKKGVCNGEKQLDMAVKIDEDGTVTDIACDYRDESGYLASMGIFVISRELLIREATNAVAHNRYHFERDLVMHGFAETGMKIKAHIFEGVALFNESPTEFFRNNLALLDPQIRHGLFGRPNLTIYTRVRDEVPAYYGAHSEIDDCIVADGCKLEGNADHSVLFRGVQLCKNANVKNCVILQDCVIGEGVELEYVILDKEVVIHAGGVFRGTPNHPMIFKKGEIV